MPNRLSRSFAGVPTPGGPAANTMKSVPPRRLPAFALLAALAAFLPGCTGGEDIAIKVAAVGRADVDEVVQSPATVRPRAAVTVRAAADGTLDELNVSDGKKAKAGEILARIDSRAARRQLRDAREADMRAAAGQVSLPRSDMSSLVATAQRSDRAARESFTAARRAAAQIPDQQQRARVVAAIADSESQYAASRAAAQAAIVRFDEGIGSLAQALSSLTAAQRVQTRAAVRTAERTVEALTIRAPISGVVSLGGSPSGGEGLDGLPGQLPPELRDQLGSGSAGSGQAGGPGSGSGSSTQLVEGVPVSAGDPVVTVTDVSVMSLAAEVDETDVLLIEPGVRADVELDAVPGASYAAKVRSVDVASRGSGGGGGVKYEVRLALGGGTRADGSPAPRPKPGMSAIAELKVRHAENAVAVPAAAVVYADGGTTVWVVEGGRADRRAVQLGAEGASMLQVTNGLRVGERVVVRGADAVEQGQELP